MAEQYDPVRYLDLLEEYTSGETFRARRNLGVLSFTIIVIDLFEASLDKIRLANLPLLEGKERLAVTVAAVLLVAWELQFAVRFWRDLEVRKERIRLLAERIDVAQNSLVSMSQAEQAHGPEIRALQRFLKAYQAQHKRTVRARALTHLLRHVEWIPTAVIALWATVICVQRYVA